MQKWEKFKETVCMCQSPLGLWNLFNFHHRENSSLQVVSLKFLLFLIFEMFVLSVPSHIPTSKLLIFVIPIAMGIAHTSVYNYSVQHGFEYVKAQKSQKAWKSRNAKMQKF